MLRGQVREREAEAGKSRWATPKAIEGGWGLLGTPLRPLGRAVPTPLRGGVFFSPKWRQQDRIGSRGLYPFDCRLLSIIVPSVSNI